MPRAIAIETSGRTGSVAIVNQDAVVTEELFPHDLKHAAELLPMIDRLVQKQGWRPKDVQELYISIGPGSFTGLRIGVTLAKTLAFATGARIVAVPSVEVLAQNAPRDSQNVIIVLDAKRGQIFTARFARQAGRLVKAEPAHLDRLTDILQRSPRPVHLIGEGLPFHQSAIPSADPSIVITPPEQWRARASAVAELGLVQSRLGNFADADTLTPLYIRLPEAEEKRLAEIKAAKTSRQ
jgi:tRNA threonylcarbamoyladenosine biosynthesis protein TsaB